MESLVRMAARVQKRNIGFIMCEICIDVNVRGQIAEINSRLISFYLHSLDLSVHKQLLFMIYIMHM